MCSGIPLKNNLLSCRADSKHAWLCAFQLIASALLSTGISRETGVCWSCMPKYTLDLSCCKLLYTYRCDEAGEQLVRERLQSCAVQCRAGLCQMP